VRSHTKFGQDRFSRFDVYWIQTNRQTDKLNLYIDRYYQFIIQSKKQIYIYIYGKKSKFFPFPKKMIFFIVSAV